MIEFNPETHNICVICGKLYSYRYIMGDHHYKCVCGLTCKWKRERHMGFFGLGYEIKIRARDIRETGSMRRFWNMVHPFNLRNPHPILRIMFNKLKRWDIVKIMDIYDSEQERKEVEYRKRVKNL